MALITTNDLENYMNKDFSAGETNQAQAIIDSIEAFLLSETGISFSLVEDEEILIQADGHGIIELNAQPIHNVSSVKDVNGEEISEWEFDGLTTIYNLFPNEVVQVTYSYGYSTAPNDLKAVAKGAASRVMYNPAGLRQETVGAISVTYPGIGGEAGSINFSNVEKKVIDKYGRRNQSLRLLATRRRIASMPVLTLTNDIP